MAKRKKLRDTVLHLKCRVLVSLHDDGSGTWSELRDRTGLSGGQIEQALRALQREEKVIVLQERHSKDGGNIYAFNDNWNPTCGVKEGERYRRMPLEKKREQNDKRTAKSRVHAVRRLVGREVDSLPPYVRFRDRKIKTLRKLLDKVGPEDRDVLLGIINDYQRGLKAA